MVLYQHFSILENCDFEFVQKYYKAPAHQWFTALLTAFHNVWGVSNVGKLLSERDLLAAVGV